MEKITCHKLLNLDINKLIDNFDNVPIPDKEKEFSVMNCNPALYLNTDFYKKLNQLGELYSLVFFMKPFADKKNIHIDIDTTTKKPLWPSLNLILKGQGTMRWFNPQQPGKLQYNSMGKVFYQAWFDNFGDVVDEWTKGKIALVRTDIPHNAWNFDNEDRLLVSIRWNNRTTWEETLDWFDKNILARD